MPAPRKYRIPGQESPPPTKPAPLPKTGGFQLRERTDLPVIREPIKPVSASTTPRNIKEGLRDKWGNITGRTLTWISEGDRLETLLSETKLRDIGVFLGIATEKVLLLEGQPTSIVGNADLKKIDQLMPALLQEMQRRGISAELTERKATIKLDV